MGVILWVIYVYVCGKINKGFKHAWWKKPYLNEILLVLLVSTGNKQVLMVVDNDCAMILWDFQIQTDKQVMANQLDIVVVDKVDKKAVVIDVAASNGSNIKKEYEKLEKYLGQLERMCGVKSSVILLVIGALGAVNPKQEEWLQQIPGVPRPLVEDPCLLWFCIMFLI